MVPVRRVVDRWLAVSLAVAPLVQLLARPALGVGGAVLAGGVCSLGVAVVLVYAVPEHDSGDAWRFGGYAFIGFAAASLAAERGASYALADHPVVGALVWLVATAVALAAAAKRRRP